MADAPGLRRVPVDFLWVIKLLKCRIAAGLRTGARVSLSKPSAFKDITVGWLFKISLSKTIAGEHVPRTRSLALRNHSRLGGGIIDYSRSRNQMFQLRDKIHWLSQVDSLTGLRSRFTVKSRMHVNHIIACIPQQMLFTFLADQCTCPQQVLSTFLAD